MSLVTKLSDAAYCGYVIGKAVERRRYWMDRARDLWRADSKNACFAVERAREANRDIVRELRSMRPVRS